ncbi:MAG: BatA and WFA domain-containing protein [Deltaproteobacteria bacterium]|nr:BatA and WFA domain-containing protein [Deltaproteobacteria bacterium]
MNFANPAALWLLATTPPLAALYFLKVRRKRVMVPTLLLWSQVVQNQRTAHPFDRFRRHLLFLLQLLALLLLTFALAGPSIAGKQFLGRSVVWILDGSGSMQATHSGAARFELAQEAVLQGIGRLQGGDEGMVVLAGPEARVVASFTRDHERLAEAVRAVKPTGAASALADAVDLASALTRSRTDRTLVVVTDGSDASLQRVVEHHPGVRTELVGRDTANTAITAIDLRRSPTVDLESELFVTLRRYGGDAGPVGVEVTLDGVLLTSETVEVAPDRPTARVYRGLGSTGGLLRVQLITGDALPLDDAAVAWMAPPRRRRILCVGCTTLTGRGLAVDPRFQLTAADASTPAEEATYDAVIYENAPVPAKPGAPFFALGPAALGAEALPAPAPWPTITTWKRTHPALRFVDPTALAITTARAGAIGGWEPLLESDAGALLSTGVHGGRRGLVLHFAPTDSDLPMRVAWPVLLLNSVGWLTGEEARGQERTVAAGSPLVREGWGRDGQTVALTRPDGSVLDAPIRDGVVRFGGLEQVGVYALAGPGGRKERIAANLVSDLESDLAVLPPAPPDAETTVARAAVAGRLSLLRPVLLLLGLLLVGEWWLYQRRYRD